MDKYYTPEIEEFHVGFICEHVEEEHLGEKAWTEFDIDSSMDMEQFVYDYHCSDESLNGLFRVKYLDQEDIDSFGEGFISMEEIWISEKVIIDLLPNQRVIIHNDDKNNPHNWYDGKIKNKSELKRVLKQIGYEQ